MSADNATIQDVNYINSLRHPDLKRCVAPVPSYMWDRHRQRDQISSPLLFKREETETRLCKVFPGQHILNPISKYFLILTKKGSRLLVLKGLGQQNLVFSLCSTTRSSSTNSPGYLIPETSSLSWHRTLQRWGMGLPPHGGDNVRTSVLWPEWAGSEGSIVPCELSCTSTKAQKLISPPPCSRLGLPSYQLCERKQTQAPREKDVQSLGPLLRMSLG